MMSCLDSHSYQHYLTSGSPGSLIYTFYLFVLCVKRDKDCEMIQKWKYCALSQEALIEPIVACELGR